MEKYNKTQSKDIELVEDLNEPEELEETKDKKQKAKKSFVPTYSRGAQDFARKAGMLQTKEQLETYKETAANTVWSSRDDKAYIENALNEASRRIENKPDEKETSYKSEKQDHTNDDDMQH